MKNSSRLSLQVAFLSRLTEEARPPAHQEDIDKCEELIGRAFPKEYRDFLLIHDGWHQYSGSMCLLGTQDYNSPEVNELFVSYIKSFVHAQGFSDFISSEDFGFSSIYKVVDGKTKLSKTQSEFKLFCDNFEEDEDWVFWPSYTLIGLDIGNGILLVADVKNEHFILEIRAAGVTGKYENFYEWVSEEYYYKIDDVS